MATSSLAALAACVVLAGPSACRPKTTGRMKVAVSIFPIYDLVRRVAGPDADVVLVLPPGRSDTGFVPTPQQTEAASGARVVVMVGLDFDPWMDPIVKAAAPKAKTLKVGDRVPTLTTGGSPFVEGTGSTIDPRVWLDPQRDSVMTKAIAEELARADAPHAALYRKRANAVTDALDALDKELETETRPWQTRSVGPALGLVYFGDRYHVRVAPPSAGSDKASEGGSDGTAPIDTLGGGPGADSLEELLRRDVADVAKTLR